ncbi:hypothetical protein [Dokdonella sp.]|uniref:hypothetical protein n=1 Tax=Dokdonella sp. TaxID=2291710 RepID=UPI0025C348F9|nr:hypothetical protein [Dokdonella sp.]MBX3690133.1 hypothetical protein [Dokdonella sp.]
MKRNLLCATVGLAGVAALFSMSASAGTCAAPTSWQPDTSGVAPLTGTTCGPGNETGIISVCQGGFGAPGAAFVALVNVAAAGTFTTITNTGGAGYALAVYWVPQASGCNTDANCTASGSEGSGGNTLHNDLPPGSYYVIVTGADFDSAGACGTFTLSADGSLPVTLQSFSVG